MQSSGGLSPRNLDSTLQLWTQHERPRNPNKKKPNTKLKPKIENRKQANEGPTLDRSWIWSLCLWPSRVFLWVGLKWGGGGGLARGGGGATRTGLELELNQFSVLATSPIREWYGQRENRLKNFPAKKFFMFGCHFHWATNSNIHFHCPFRRNLKKKNEVDFEVAIA